MSIPRKAQQQLEAAEELHRQMYATETSELDAPSDEDTNLDQNPESIQTTTPDPVESADPAPQDDGHVAPVDDSWEEKYRKLEAAHKTLQGKYGAEVPRLNSKVKDLTTQLDAARKGQAAAQSMANKAQQEVSDLTNRLQEEVGEDATKAISDYANSLIDNRLNAIKEEEQATEQKNTQERFFDAIYQEIPDFDMVNQNPSFDQWLFDNRDPITGLTLKQSINQAGTTLDAETVIKITKQFIERRETAPDTPPQETQPIQNEHISAPKTPAPTKQPEQPQYTAEDYTQLMREIQRGKWRGREAEASALERKIHAALTGQ